MGVRGKQWFSKDPREVEHCGTMNRNWENKRVLHRLNKAELAFIVTVTEGFTLNHKSVIKDDMTKTVLILTEWEALCAYLLFCPTVPGNLLGRLESASLGSYPGLPFLTSNFLLPILFRSFPPHARTHACAHRNTHMFTLIPKLSPGSLPRLTVFTRGQIFLQNAHGRPFNLRCVSSYQLPPSSPNLSPAHLQIKSLWTLSTANIIHLFNLHSWVLHMLLELNTHEIV